MMDAVILCGGLGTRLRPVEANKPKGLAEVDGRPFLDILLGWVIVQGARRVILCVGHGADQIERHYRVAPSGVELVFSREQTPQGTAGALRLAKPHILTNDFFVFNGDSFCDVSLEQLGRQHRDRAALATLTLTRVPERGDFGQVVMDSDQRILRFVEKNAEAISDWINGGVYCLSREIFDLFPSTSPLSLEKDCFPVLLGKAIYGFPAEGVFFDIGTPERLRLAGDIVKQHFKLA